jgi:L-threonylcarbamoyladenylate synthase
MYLYPTETIYGLGANPFDAAAVDALFALKGRDASKSVSWLVPDVAAIQQFAVVSDRARQIMDTFLPGPVTVVLPLLPEYQQYAVEPDGTVGFRISSDSVAQQLINTYWRAHGTPLTCTSANVSGEAPASTPALIIEQFQQFGRDTSALEVRDDGPRAGVASTVVRIVGDELTVLRPGAVTVH